MEWRVPRKQVWIRHGKRYGTDDHPWTKGTNATSSHALCLLTDRLQIVTIEDVACGCTATVTINCRSLPHILVQKESRHWASAPSLCKIFIERSRDARIARYWLKSELRFQETIRIFLVHRLIPVHHGLWRVMHVEPLCPVRTASWLLFSASSVALPWYNHPKCRWAGVTKPSQWDLLISLASCSSAKMKNAPHAKVCSSIVYPRLKHSLKLES